MKDDALLCEKMKCGDACRQLVHEIHAISRYVSFQQAIG